MQIPLSQSACHGAEPSAKAAGVKKEPVLEGVGLRNASAPSAIACSKATLTQQGRSFLPAVQFP